MNDYVQQLKDYRKKTWGNRTEWTESDIRTLIETGKCAGHPTSSCNTMLSCLRYDPAVRNRYCKLVHELGDKINKDRKGRHASLTKEEIELMTRHIVPYGRTKSCCQTTASKGGLFDTGAGRQPWSYENKKEYEARTGKAVTEPVAEPAKETVETRQQSEFELHVEAVKTMVSGGMDVCKVAKILGIDEVTINALMHIVTKYGI